MLQIDGADDDALMRMHSDEIGMDSLIAVDIRSWFLKQLNVSIPVLKILNGVSIAEYVEEAVAKISPELTPNLVEGGLATGPSPSAANFTTAPSPGPQSTESSVPSSPSFDTPGSGAASRMSEETVLTPPPEAVDHLSLSKGEESPLVSLSAAALARIPVVAKPLTLERSLSLSHTQSMFWLIHSLLEDKTTLNHTGCIRMTGRVRVQDLKVAVQQICNRHESMRTCFYLDENNKESHKDDAAGQGHMVMQGILTTGRLELEHMEIESYEEMDEKFNQLRNYVYDLSKGEFMRLILLTRTDSPIENYFMIGAHHINFDGVCTQILLRELEAFYARQAHLTLSPAAKQYSSFIASQRGDETTGAWDSDLAFWRREFATIPEPLPLTRARVVARKPLLRYDVHHFDFRLDPLLAERVRVVARQHRVTAFHFYLAAFRVVLQRFLSLGLCDGQRDGGKETTDDSDICIGIADSNRHDEETLGSLGPYLNLLALRFRDRPATFASALASARDKTFAALGHAAVPFDAVLRALRVHRDMSHAPLFQAFLDYRLGFPNQQPFADCTLELLRFEPGRTAYDLSVDVIDTPLYNDASAPGGKGGGGALLSVFGQASLYEQEDVRIFAACFEDVIREFAEEPSKSLVGRGSEWSYRDADVTKALELSRGTHSISTS
jgi:hybrid polyketide synthase/nonribosomal peptide synthetase ACE1